MLYLIDTIDQIPVGTNYRILEQCCTYWSNKMLVQTLEECADLQIADSTFPSGTPTDPDYDPEYPCIIPWQTRGITDNG